MSRATRLSAGAVIAALVMFQAAPASAHGERTQPSWVRSTTSTFFDLEYSGDARIVDEGEDRVYVLDLGEVLRVTGKVQISDKWPAALGGFNMGAIGVLMQGPVLALRDLKVNGVFVPGSIVMEPGDLFEFEAELVARRTGRYHIHPRIDLKDKGPTVGPGTWVRVRDNGDYDRDVTLASGETVDLERFALGRVYSYHLFWIALAAFFCAGVLWRKRLLSRLLAVRWETPDRELLSSRDRHLTTIVGGLTLAVIVGGFVYARNEWTTIPIQVRREYVPEVRPPQLADARLTEARYDEDGQSLSLRLELTNQAASPIQVERLVMGPVSLAPSSFAGDLDEALRLEPSGALEPGQTRTVELTFASDALEEHRLLFTNSAVAQIGGLLIVRDADGQRSWVTLVADLIEADAETI